MPLDKWGKAQFGKHAGHGSREAGVYWAMALSKFKWAQELERSREESDYLRQNQEGADIGGMVGGLTGGVAAVGGIVVGTAYASIVVAGAAAELAAGAGGATAAEAAATGVVNTGAAVAGGAAGAEGAGAIVVAVVAAAATAGRSLGVRAVTTTMEHTVYGAVDVGQ